MLARLDVDELVDPPLAPIAGRSSAESKPSELLISVMCAIGAPGAPGAGASSRAAVGEGVGGWDGSAARCEYDRIGLLVVDESDAVVDSSVGGWMSSTGSHLSGRASELERDGALAVLG